MQAVQRACPVSGMWGEEFSEMSGGHMQTMMGVKGDFELNLEAAGEPVQGVKNEGDPFIFTHPHQNLDRAILYILELLKALARDSDEECVTVVQPGGDKGMDELLSRKTGEITRVWQYYGDGQKKLCGSG